MAHKFTSAAQAELACSLCFQYYVPPHDPMNFPNCAHTCCRLCLKKMTEGGWKRRVKCPQCNKVSRLPGEGVDGLMTALALRNLAGKHPEGIKQRKQNMHDDLAKEKVETSKIVTKLHAREKKMRESIKEEELKVEKSVEAIMTKAQELNGQIHELSEPKLTDIRQQRAQLEAQIKTIEATQSKLQIMSDDEFLTQTDTLTAQIAKLQIEESASAASFKEDHTICTFLANAQLGRLVQLRNLELVQEFGKFQFIYGIAALSTASLAIYDREAESEQVTVFEYESGQYRGAYGFNIKDAESCCDIATTSGDKILIPYLSERGIDMYSSDGKYQKQIISNLDIKEGIPSITTMADGRILAGSAKEDEDGAFREPKVTVYDAEGHVLQTIPTSITPFRIADIRGTMAAVSDAINNKVCVYDVQSGKETLTIDINKLKCVIYDEQSDCLLIARGTEVDEDGRVVRGSCVIEQYCSTTGTLVACLAQGLLGPWSMTLTRDGMLAVADEKTVKLYKIS